MTAYGDLSRHRLKAQVIPPLDQPKTAVTLGKPVRVWDDEKKAYVHASGDHGSLEASASQAALLYHNDPSIVVYIVPFRPVSLSTDEVAPPRAVC
jgi:hypothetical protein